MFQSRQRVGTRKLILFAVFGFALGLACGYVFMGTVHAVRALLLLQASALDAASLALSLENLCPDRRCCKRAHQCRKSLDSLSTVSLKAGTGCTLLLGPSRPVGSCTGESLVKELDLCYGTGTCA